MRNRLGAISGSADERPRTDGILGRAVRSWLEEGLDRLREQLIGRNRVFDGPLGPKPLLYADYAASGRGLKCVEQFLLDEVLPFYANPHTQASHCGRIMNELRAEARSIVAYCCGAGPEVAVVFSGSGATSGINKLARMLVPETGRERTLVLIGPYEHHSNILPWRECGAEVVEIREASLGGPDLDHLEGELAACASGRPIIGAFSAASNVTGILTDPGPVTKLLKRYGALAIWDYAGGAPYLEIDFDRHGFDAIVLSPHKFPGGPGASGLLLVQRGVGAPARPTDPGGGTVSFVSPWSHHYLEDLECREEAGTPNSLGDIRAALCLLIKEAIGGDRIERREHELAGQAFERWSAVPGLELLGNEAAPRIPIFSFRIADPSGGHVHHQLVTRMLSDRFGVQARGGCACAGPYAHRLLGLDRRESDRLWQRLSCGHELEKPGWTRVNFSYVMTDDEVEAIISSIEATARNAWHWASDYVCNPKTARFSFAPGGEPGSSGRMLEGSANNRQTCAE